QLHCRQCGQIVRKDSPQQIWETLQKANAANQSAEFLITFDVPLSEKLPLADSLGLIAKQGYQRLLIDGQIARLDDVLANASHHASRLTHLTVIQDRVKVLPANR